MPGDFADWLSPVLVKELRQGLRTKTFAGIFIGVHQIMITIIAIWLASLATSQNPGQTHSEIEGFFWSLIGFALIIAMPLRGLAALSTEIKAKTLDLVQMTRMSAFRIVTGKWLAVAAQSALIVVSVLPYAALRYFFGRVDVVSDLKVIGWMFAASLLLTALAIAASVLGPVLRGLMIFFVVYFGVTGGVLFGFSRMMGGTYLVSSIATAPNLWFLVAVTILLVAYIWLALEDAASRIAPAAENHAARKRTAALMLLILPCIAGAMREQEVFRGLIAGIVPFLLWVCVTAMCENTADMPGLYRPWAQRGVLGRLAGRLLYPGCETAILYTVVVSGIAVSLPALFGDSLNPGSTKAELATGLAIVMALVFPALIFAWFNVKESARFLVYILVHAVCLLAYSLVDNFSSNHGTESVLCFFPTCALVHLTDNSAHHAEGVLRCLAVTAVIMALLFTIRIAKSFRWISHLERESLKNAPETQPA